MCNVHKANDGNGSVSGPLEVRLKVDDENSAPYCSSHSAVVKVLAGTNPGAIIFTLLSSCYDDDVNATYNSLTFHEYATNGIFF